MNSRMYPPSVMLLACLLALLADCRDASADSFAGHAMIVGMAPLTTPITSQDTHIDYNINPAQEQFFLKVPAQYTDDTPYGVVVYLGSDDQLQQIPSDWDTVLDERKLIFVSPQNAGKTVATNRRLGLAVYTALEVEQHWNIDKKRVFVAGFGNNARLAGLLGFYAPDIFTGSVQMGGADFYTPVPQVDAKAAAGDPTPYGTQLADATPAEINAAKSFRFAFLTGEDDRLQKQITDIVDGGYAKEGFQYTLLHVPGIGHELCSPRRFALAIDFLDGTKTAKTPTTQPVRAPWMAKDPSHWPRILLSNELIDPGNGVGDSGSSSFGRLPGGAVVLFTARHLLGDASLADFPKLCKSWIAFTTSPTRGVRITRVAMDPNEPTSFDGLVLCPASQNESWPSAVLPVRQEPLEIGDTIYLVAVPNGRPRDQQNVFKGTVIRNIEDKQMVYLVDADFDTLGCSGAPIIDEYGRLAAINLGHLLDQNIPGKKQLTCMSMSDVLQAIKLPADVHPISRPVASPAAAAPTPTTPRELTSQRADDALRRAQLYLDNHLYSKAQQQLQNIIDTYPTTDAATKARALLAQIPSS
jgi:hypothetical protein